jgi:hypothetical protein
MVRLPTVVALIIEPLGVFFLGGTTLRIFWTSLLLPPPIVDPIGSIFSNAAILTVVLSLLQMHVDRTGLHVQAYADYNDLMDMTEHMISEMVKEIKGSYKISYHANGPDAEPVEIDFTPPWRRISMIEELEKVLHVQIPSNLETEEAREFLVKLCKEKEVECSPPQVECPAKFA